jgi:hypothetical protein
MSIANAMGGTPSLPWKLARDYSLDTLIADALDRKLPVRDFKAAVTGTPFMETKAYLRVRELIGGRSDFPS